MSEVTSLPLRCRCGAFAGTVEIFRRRGIRVVCYCDDCQAYARALQREDVLDRFGGTDIWQTAPSHVKFTKGLEHLCCLRLSEGGMFRWHTRCCMTPIGNTMAGRRMPFVGIVHAIMDHSAHLRDDALGPAHRVQGRFAVGGVPPGASANVPFGLIVRSIAFLARGALTGAHRPSPFFDAGGAPAVTPRVLSAEQRDALRSSAP